jgi:hypothetical protein
VYLEKTISGKYDARSPCLKNQQILGRGSSLIIEIY